MTHEEVIKSIEKGLRTKYDSGREDRHIHVSDLADFCTRKFAYSVLEDAPFNPKSWADLGMLMTRAIGVKVEDIIVQGLRDNRDVSNLIHTNNLMQIPIADWMLVGRPDLVIGTQIYEIKSMRVEDFELDYVSPSYQVQALGYMWCAKHKLGKKQLANVNTKSVTFIKACKAHKPQPYKCLDVQYDKSFDIKMANIEADLKKFAKNRKNIPAKVCSGLHCSLAKKCPFRGICFADE